MSRHTATTRPARRLRHDHDTAAGPATQPAGGLRYEATALHDMAQCARPGRTCACSQGQWVCTCAPNQFLTQCTVSELLLDYCS